MSIDAVQALNEIVTKLDTTDLSRCHNARDFQGWVSLWRRRHHLDQPDWLQDALAEVEPDEDEGDESLQDEMYFESLAQEDDEE
jgi:hypothetical protein